MRFKSGTGILNPPQRQIEQGQPRVHCVFIQTGHYADAYRRFAEGGAETYRDQRASVQFVADLLDRSDLTRVTTVSTTGPHQDELAPGLISEGIARDQDAGALLDRLAPDRLILRLPHLPLIKAAKARNIPTLPCFADLFQQGGPRTRWTNWQLMRALRNGPFPCIANHSLNASQTLKDVLRLDPSRIVPWDWARLRNVAPARTGLHDATAPCAFYAGALSADKGVGDCLRAVQQTPGLRMTFAGGGDLDHWRAKAAQMDIADRVDFIGLIPHDQVRAQMAAHDMVIVPSRHSYPEGLPNVIYEALASRSPLILSDHPAFRGRLTPGTHCLEFTASDPQALAQAITRITTDQSLFSQLSNTSEAGLEGLYIGMEWNDLVTQFLDDPQNQTGWVTANSLRQLS